MHRIATHPTGTAPSGIAAGSQRRSIRNKNCWWAKLAAIPYGAAPKANFRFRRFTGVSRLASERPISGADERPNPDEYGTYDDHGDEGAVDILIVRGRPEKELYENQRHTAGYQHRSHN